MRFTLDFRRDCIVVFALILAAFIVRVPYVSHPNETVFDEYYYATLTSNDVNGWRYFSYHPPLSTMYFGIFMNRADTPFIGDTIKLPYGDFPFERGRFMSVLAGSLIPGLVYLIFRQLKIPWKFALLGAGITVIDSLLITYSRLMLPDSLLWVCGLLSLVFSFLAVRSVTYRSILYGCIAAIFVGLAVSVKWTGLVFGAVTLLAAFVLTKQSLRNMLVWSLIGSLIIIVTYISIISFHLRYFDSGYSDSSRSTAAVSGELLYFPDSRDIPAIFRFIENQIIRSVQIQADFAKYGKIIIVGKPECWPFSCGSFGGWYSDHSRLIFGGNIPAYAISAFSILFLAGFYGITLLRRGCIDTQKEELYIFLSFVCVYVSTAAAAYFRPMYLYHYVPAYFFAIAALSVCLGHLYEADVRVGKIAIQASVILVLIFFFIQSPYTYGF